MGDFTVRPLRRVRPGCWRSRDGLLTFMRHWSDPHPQRWFLYVENDPEGFPWNEGLGHTALSSVVKYAETLARADVGLPQIPASTEGQGRGAHANRVGGIDA